MKGYKNRSKKVVQYGPSDPHFDALHGVDIGRKRHLTPKIALFATFSGIFGLLGYPHSVYQFHGFRIT